MKKNIWIINHYARIGEGRHYNLGLNLVKKGYSVKIICASTSLKNRNVKFDKTRNCVIENYNGIEYYIFKARNYVGNGKERFKNIFEFSFRTYNFFKKTKSLKPDIIYASSVHPLAWVVGYRLSKIYKSQLLIETRDLWPETLINMGRIKKKSIVAKLMYRLEKFMYKKADCLIFTMPGGKKYLDEKGYKYKRYEYINNGVDIQLFNKNVNDFPSVYFEKNQNLNVVYAGSMGIANSVKTILDAAKYLQEKDYLDIKFHLFGDGYLNKELREYAKSLNLKNVKFYGQVNKSNIPGILSSGDLNIATSQNISLYDYGVSLNKYFDYFASGKPTITNIPSPYNKIVEYKCGIHVKPEDPKELALGIVKINNLTKDEYKQMCENALNAAVIFDYSNLANKLDDIIKTV